MDDLTPTVDASSKPPRRFRRTRIAVSVFFGVVTLALVVLWMRSYWRCDDVSLGISNGPGYKFLSLTGEVGVWRYPTREGAVRVGWSHASVPANKFPSLSSRQPSQFLGFSFGMLGIVVPQWFVVVLTTALATSPWMWQVSFQFSLRSMLIATALLAIALGLGVWLAR